MSDKGPTQKQVQWAIILLDRAQFLTKYMDNNYLDLGATPQQITGTVGNWLANMTRDEISDLIDRLTKKKKKKRRKR